MKYVSANTSSYSFTYCFVTKCVRKQFIKQCKYVLHSQFRLQEALADINAIVLLLQSAQLRSRCHNI